MPLKHEKPNPRLMAELLEVRSAAEDLKKLISITPGLPNQFPFGPLENMLLSLIGLPDGTAADARPILHAADKRSVKLRYEYSKHPRENEPNRDPDYIPPFERGQKLDTRLSRLHTALGTALEECRVQEIGDHPDEDFDPWGYDKVDNDPDVQGLDGQDRRDLESGSEALNKAISETSEGAREIIDPETENSDRFLRNLTGLRNLNLSASAEAAFSKGKSKINDSLQLALEAKPKLLNAAADGIQTGVDYARPLHKAWTEFKKDKLGYALNKAEQLSGYLRQHARDLTPPPPVDPEIQKAAETEAVHLLRQNLPVPDDIAVNVRNLEIYEPGKMGDFQDAERLANIRWLLYLDVDNTGIEDIAPLAAHRHLTHCYLRRTKVKELAPLENLTALQTLRLNGTKVTDLTPLENLSALKWLNLSGTHVTDLAPLANLAALKALNLDNTQVSDLAPLENLSALQTLDLSGTQVKELAPLENLSTLQTLNLRGTQVTDLAPLENLSALQELHLRGTQVTDWSPVAHVKNVSGRPE